MAQAMETVAAPSGQSKAGKYLTFALSNEEYGLEILKVREIIGYMQITAVPQTPPMSRASSTSADRSSPSWTCG